MAVQNVCICKKCKDAFVTSILKCPNCGGELIKSRYSSIYWEKCSEEQRNEILSQYVDGPVKIIAKMQCPKCYKTIPSETHFCKYCGCDIESYKKEVDEIEKRNLERDQEKGKKNLKKTILQISALLVSIVLIVLICITVYNYNQSKPASTTPASSSDFKGDPVYIDPDADEAGALVNEVDINQKISIHEMDRNQGKDESDPTGKAIKSGDEVTATIQEKFGNAYYNGDGRQGKYYVLVFDKPVDLMVHEKWDHNQTVEEIDFYSPDFSSIRIYSKSTLSFYNLDYSEYVGKKIRCNIYPTFIYTSDLNLGISAYIDNVSIIN